MAKQSVFVGTHTPRLQDSAIEFEPGVGEPLSTPLGNYKQPSRSWQTVSVLATIVIVPKSEYHVVR